MDNNGINQTEKRNPLDSKKDDILKVNWADTTQNTEHTSLQLDKSFERKLSINYRASSDEEDIDFDTENKPGSKTKFLIMLVKKIVVINLGVFICLIPAFILRRKYPNVPLLKKLDVKDPQYSVKSAVSTSIYLSCLASILWFLFIVITDLISLIQKITVMIVKKIAKKKVAKVHAFFEVLESVGSTLTMTLISAIGCIIWASFFFESSIMTFSFKTEKSNITWNQLAFKYLVLFFIASLMFLFEAFFMLNLSAAFHKMVYKDRIDQQQKTVDAIAELEMLTESNNSNGHFISITPAISYSDTYGSPSIDSYTSQTPLDDMFIDDISHGNLIKRAKKLFYRLRKNSTSKVLVPEDFIYIYKNWDTERAIEVFNLFDSNRNGSISRIEFQQAFTNCSLEKNILSKTLTDMSQVIGKIHRFLVFVILCVTFLLALTILSFDPISSIAPLVTLIFALSFTFGNSLKETFDCIIFLFMSHPYDVGDHIRVDEDHLKVKKIKLLTTVFMHLNGQNITIPNVILAKKKIINFRRSENQKEGYEIGIDFDTPEDKIDELISRLKSFVEGNPLDYKPIIGVKYLNMENSSLLKIALMFTFRTNWQNTTYYWKARNNIISRIRKEMVNLGLTYSTEIKNIRLVGQEDSSILPLQQ
ncbi:hypothetical protein BB558_004392 [Smittium angustum]|uniref:EF-hand domain-containing protein n=1 Tax=Smittium angustum TaxID=133377 RepID=A0A2U1J3L9_SMIAN|nr:hypothetical protein BB558_004392 [Smittium angustum]